MALALAASYATTGAIKIEVLQTARFRDGSTVLMKDQPPAKMEPKVPGYKGFVPGRQHVYARTFGMTTSELGSAHQKNKQDKNSFISFSDPR